jgi:hypothetical protein
VKEVLEANVVCCMVLFESAKSGGRKYLEDKYVVKIHSLFKFDQPTEPIIQVEGQIPREKADSIQIPTGSSQ